MDEALALAGCFRRAGMLWQQRDDLGSQVLGVDELAERLAGMDRRAGDRDHRLIGREALVGKLAEWPTVEGVGILRGQLGEVEGIDATADLFVGREAEPDLA